jgi:hypothetical protein
VSALEAGRELDALIAERVMRWSDVGEKPMYALDGGDTLNGPPARLVQEGTAWRGTRPDGSEGFLPAYSSDIAAAWLVVEKLGMSVVCSEDGWYALKPEDIEHSTLRGTAFPTIVLVGKEFAYPEPADTAPLAICRAALLAVEAPR